MRREDDRAETTLPGVGDVFGVDEKGELAESLLAEDAHHPEGPRPEAVGQVLAACVVSLDPDLEIILTLEQQRGV